MFITMAIHRPRPEYFAAFMGRIEHGMKGADGLLSLESFRDPQRDCLVAIGRWESAEHARAGVPRLLAIGGRAPEWSERPDELYALDPLDTSSS